MNYLFVPLQAMNLEVFGTLYLLSNEALNFCGVQYTPTTFLVPCEHIKLCIGVYVHPTCSLHVFYMYLISGNEVMYS